MAEFNQDPRASGPVITGFTARGFKLDGDNLGPRRVEGERHAHAGFRDAMGCTRALMRWISTPWTQVLAMDPVPEFMLLGTGPALAHPPRALRPGDGSSAASASR